MAPHGQWVGEDQMRNSRRRSKAKYDQVIQKALDPKQLAAIHTRCLEVIESHIYIYISRNFPDSHKSQKASNVFPLRESHTSTGETSVVSKHPTGVAKLTRQKHFEKIIVPNLCFFIYILYRLEELLTFQESFFNH